MSTRHCLRGENGARTALSAAAFKKCKALFAGRRAASSPSPIGWERAGVRVSRLLILTVNLFLFIPGIVYSFPPAPHHIIYGLVRDEMGTPIAVTNAIILFESSAGTQIKSDIVPNLEPGNNYRLTVPIDTGLTADAYKPTALKPTTPFRIKVQIGNTTYLPIEMVANYSSLGQPAKSTRIDLTLGVDSDGDGIPDAWERSLISVGGGTLADITRNGDYDGDGISNFAEYVAGTYAFDPADGFALKMIGANNGKPLFEFLAIRNHAYTIHGSPDLGTWTEVNFTLSEEGAGAVLRRNYQATDVRNVRVEADLPANTTLHFFKVEVR